MYKRQIPYEDVRVNVVETGSLGVNEPTHGSRATFAIGKAAVEACNEAIKEMCIRAANKWGIDPEQSIGLMAPLTHQVPTQVTSLQ